MDLWQSVVDARQNYDTAVSEHEKALERWRACKLARIEAWSRLCVANKNLDAYCRAPPSHDIITARPTEILQTIASFLSVVDRQALARCNKRLWWGDADNHGKRHGGILGLLPAKERIAMILSCEGMPSLIQEVVQCIKFPCDLKIGQKRMAAKAVLAPGKHPFREVSAFDDYVTCYVSGKTSSKLVCGDASIVIRGTYILTVMRHPVFTDLVVAASYDYLYVWNMLDASMHKKKYGRIISPLRIKGKSLCVNVISEDKKIVLVM